MDMVGVIQQRGDRFLRRLRSLTYLQIFSGGPGGSKKIFLCETEFQTYIPYTIFVIVLTLRITSKSISPNGCQILIMVFSLSIICVDPFPSNFFSNFEDAAH